VASTILRSNLGASLETFSHFSILVGDFAATLWMPASLQFGLARVLSIFATFVVRKVWLSLAVIIPSV
jgi:hypothetical protein